jgi:hypothetical protein
MSRRTWRLTGLLGCLVLLFGTGVLTLDSATAAESTGPGGTYYCWDRCRTGVGCNTVCYVGTELITCNEYSPSCGGADGVVGQHCGDGVCHFDAGLPGGYENASNCPTDCRRWS